MINNADNLTPRTRFRTHSLNKIPFHAKNVTGGLVKTQKVALKVITEQETIESTMLTTNYVFPIEKNENVIGYVKVGRHGEEGCALMEKFVWKCSIIFGVSDFFTPTEKIRISSDKVKKFSVELENPTTYKVKRYSLGVLTPHGSLRGSFQVAETGIPLEQFIDNKQRLSSLIHNEEEAMKMLIRASLITIVFGMFDAHAANIMIDKAGQIKFFDNTKSFPHSNGIYCCADDLVVSYRSALLELPESYEQLSPDLLIFAKKELKEYRQKFDKFKEFLNREETQEMIDELPLGWFNQELALNAMEARLSNLERALENPRIKTVAGLIEAAIPYHRFLGITQSINRLLKHKDVREGELEDENLLFIWKDGMAYAVVEYIEESLYKASQLGINLEEILSLCNKDISYIELIKQVIPLLDNPKDSATSLARITKKLYDHAEIDLKDIPSNSAYYHIDFYVKKYLELEKFPINDPKHPYSIIINPVGGTYDPNNYKLVYINANGDKVTHPLRVYKNPGLITLRIIGESTSMTIPELHHWVRMKCVE